MTETNLTEADEFCGASRRFGSFDLFCERAPHEDGWHEATVTHSIKPVSSAPGTEAAQLVYEYDESEAGEITNGWVARAADALRQVAGRCSYVSPSDHGCWLLEGHESDHLPDASGLGAVSGHGPSCRHCGTPIVRAPSGQWADTGAMTVCEVTPGRYRAHEPEVPASPGVIAIAAEHDAHHDDHQLAKAAACYALRAAGIHHVGTHVLGTAFPWPWHPADFKPGDDPVRTLAKAGALLAAEIDRLSAAARETR
jgi:hypothetical protein